MDWHVITLSDHVPTLVKNCAGIIAPLFDVWGKCCALQRRTHFLRDRVK
jgi:hypothetical protein